MSERGVSARLAQAEFLLQRERFQDAESLLREMLAADTTNAGAHALLAFALLYQNRPTDALLEAQAAVRFAPDDAFGHYVGAIVLLQMDNADEALSAIREAVRLAPEQARYHAIEGSIHLRNRDWQKALDAAETGLSFDPRHVQCANLRAMALVKLGRRDEAGQTLDAALARDPENPMTHANHGWALLHQGDHERALHHFREALRLNPSLAWAREGIVEALRARNPVYRLLLRYFLWMSRLQIRAQWGLIVGAVILNNIIDYLAFNVPALRPFLTPFNYLYTAFAFLSWTARPLFTLLLRFDRFGRLALSGEEIVASNWTGVCLLGAVGGLAAALATGYGVFLTFAISALAMIVPVSGLFRFPRGKRRTFLVGYAVLLALLATGGVGLSLLGYALGPRLSSLFMWGWILYSWVANAVAAMK